MGVPGPQAAAHLRKRKHYVFWAVAAFSALFLLKEKVQVSACPVLGVAAALRGLEPDLEAPSGIRGWSPTFPERGFLPPCQPLGVHPLPKPQRGVVPGKA